MQRNVFGHAIYQIIILITIIFAAPGWLCEPYWNRCVTGGLQVDDNGEVAGDTCSWNAFYVDGHYYLDKNSAEEGAEGGEGGEEVDGASLETNYIEWWKAKGLSEDKYDSAILKRFSCMAYMSS